MANIVCRIDRHNHSGAVLQLDRHVLLLQVCRVGQCAAKHTYRRTSVAPRLRPVRISGPLVSSAIATGRPAILAASRALAAVVAWNWNCMQIGNAQQGLANRVGAMRKVHAHNIDAGLDQVGQRVDVLRLGACAAVIGVASTDTARRRRRQSEIANQY